MSELFDLHRKYNAVKTRDKYPYAWIYTQKIYPSFFEAKRSEAVTVLEIGIFKGAGLQAMRDYFPRGTIVGVDIDPQCQNENRIAVEKGSQNDVAFMKAIGDKYGPFDFIIEDGSHKFHDQKTTLLTMLPYLKKEGVFFFEDITPRHAGDYVFNWIVQNYLRPELFLEQSTPYSVFFYPGMIALQKHI